MKKKKTSWKTLAGLVLAAATWRSIAEDLPIDGVIIPPSEDEEKLYRYNGGYTSVEPPTCPPFEVATYDTKTKRWYCVPKGLL